MKITIKSLLVFFTPDREESSAFRRLLKIYQKCVKSFIFKPDSAVTRSVLRYGVHLHI